MTVAVVAAAMDVVVAMTCTACGCFEVVPIAEVELLLKAAVARNGCVVVVGC